MNNQIHPGGIPPQCLIPATFLGSVVAFVMKNCSFPLLFFSGNCGAKFRKIFENQKKISLNSEASACIALRAAPRVLRPEGEQNARKDFILGNKQFRTRAGSCLTNGRVSTKMMIYSLRVQHLSYAILRIAKEKGNAAK
jgi:hypothetical protein